MKLDILNSKDDYKKRKIVLYFLLRLLVIVVIIVQAYNKNYDNVFACVLALVLFMIPTIIDKKLNIKLPNVLETIILLFIFSALILGEIQNFYTTFKYWDTILHIINGFIMGGIGFALIDILNKSDKFHITLTPVFVALVAFCFSMTIGTLWEFFEFTSDSILKTDMQKDTIVNQISSVKLNIEGKNVPVIFKDIHSVTINNDISGIEEKYVINEGYLDIGLIDTMKDLMVNCVGAIVFCLIGYQYITSRGKKRFAENFIPKMKTDIEIAKEQEELNEIKRKIYRLKKKK